MCLLLLAPCFFGCTNQTTESAKTIAMDTLRGLEGVLKHDFFRAYDIGLLECSDSPQPGLVKEVIFKKQLLNNILKGLKQADVNASTLSMREERIISLQLIHFIFSFVITGEPQFEYNTRLKKHSTIGDYHSKRIPYIQQDPDGARKIIQSIRNLPNGSEMKLGPKEALNLQIAQAVCAVLKKLDIAQATSISLNEARSNTLDENERKEKIAMLSLKMGRI